MATDKYRVNYELVSDKTSNAITSTEYLKHGDKWLDKVIDDMGVFVTPEMFGAKGDGVTDDTTALSNAIGTGKPVYISDGVYLINSEFEFTKNATIYGEKNSVIKAKSSGSSLFIINNKKISVSNITFDGDSNVTHIFSSASTSYDFESVIVKGSTGIAIIQESLNINEYNETKISNCIINNGIRFYGNDYTTFSMINSKIFSNNDACYFVANCNYAEVKGGEFSGGSNTSSNLYSCKSSNIIGGYYHDMRRGATIGGKTGRTGNIIGTINKNMNYCGVSVDLATGGSSAGYEEDYTDGFCTVSNNVIDNCKYGLFIQSRNTVISNNTVKMNVVGTGTQYGIRLNCVTSTDSGNVIANNIINCDNNPDCFAIYLQDNTIATIINNKIVGANTSIHGGANSALKSTGKMVTISANYQIHADDDIICYEGSTNNIDVYVANPNYIVPIGKEITLINKSENNRMYISSKYEGVSIIGISRNYLLPNGILKIICLDKSTWFAKYID